MNGERETRRHGWYNVICTTGRHLILERGNKILKIPVHLSRKIDGATETSSSTEAERDSNTKKLSVPLIEEGETVVK